MRRYLAAAVFAVVAAGCAKKQTAPSVQTAAVTRRDIIVDAQANGTIEPITIIDVKSKASGVITKMPVETGTHVKPGDLIAQIDTRQVQNSFDQANAEVAAAQSKLDVATSNRKRNEDLLKARVITPQEFEQVEVDYESANAGVVSAKANLDIAKQALEDATVKAPSDGTIIAKNVAEGTVIASATGTVSGGTDLVQMADLSTVRIRAFFNESDIGNVHPGEQANVTVDAYQDRRFRGVVDQIEPEAVIQQNVTMFPVLVNLVNQEGLLMPGMNGEVSVLIDERDGVLAVPNDAIKSPREAVATGAMLGLSADTVNAELKAQGYSPTPRGGFGGGRRGGGRRGGDANGAPAPAPGAGAPAGAPGGAPGTAGGDVALVQQGQGGGGQGGQGFQQASDADCTTLEATLKAHPADKKQLDDLRAKLTAMRPAGAGGNRRGGNAGGNGGGASAGGGHQSGGGGARRSNGGNSGNSGSGANAGGDAAGAGPGRRGNPQMQAINEQMRAIYTKLNIDPRTAGSCARRQGGATQLAAGGQGGPGGQGGQLTPQSELGRGAQRTRPGLVFVADSGNTRFHPRIVQIGEANLDYTEIVSGLKEGEHVVLLSALALQAARQAQLDRARGASPLGGGGPGGGRGRG